MNPLNNTSSKTYEVDTDNNCLKTIITTAFTQTEGLDQLNQQLIQAKQNIINAQTALDEIQSKIDTATSGGVISEQTKREQAQAAQVAELDTKLEQVKKK